MGSLQGNCAQNIESGKFFKIDRSEEQKAYSPVKKQKGKDWFIPKPRYLAVHAKNVRTEPVCQYRAKE
jgi:hypothetical protein